jgi:uncharacterized phage protein (TIGR01671 family)
MSRKIKFKAPRYRDSIYGKSGQPISGWVTFDFQSFDADWNDSSPFIKDIETGEEVPNYLIDLSKVRQFTGLQDKNGKEIYEGDILRSQPTPDLTVPYVTWEMAWEQDVFSDGRPIFSLYSMKHRTASDWHTIGEVRKPLEVIGNIYENSELLEGQR